MIRILPSIAVALSALVLTGRLNGQPPQQVINDYVTRYSEAAVNEMIEHHIPASVILAQAIFESAAGTSGLASRSNNHFGIKCHKEWGGDTVHQDDDIRGECFRKYRSVEDSYRDHSLFLRSRPRYRELFAIPQSDYAAWCHALKSTGYATHPGYAEKLIDIIESLGLNRFDHFASIRRQPVAYEPQLREAEPLRRRSLKHFANNGLFTFAEDTRRDIRTQDADMSREPRDIIARNP